MATQQPTSIQDADYRVQTITGKTYRRANRIVINNPYGGPASLAFDEEQLTLVDGQAPLARPVDMLHHAVDLTASIALIDPATGLATGQTMTQADVYVALYSLYLQLAAARDAQG